jgi:hypothetical protein
MRHIHSLGARVLTQVVTVACLVLAFIAQAHATSVLPAYLEQLIDDSSVAFEATCTGNRTERDPATNLVATYTTFAVHDVLKGAADTAFEIKQIGGTLPDGSVRYRVDGVPSFDPGQDYVVFLAGVSPLGFSSPIALGQGAFGIRPKGAAKVVSNGRDFREMMAHMASTLPSASQAKLAQTPVPIRDWDLEDFKRIVRERVAGLR